MVAERVAFSRFARASRAASSAEFMRSRIVSTRGLATSCWPSFTPRFRRSGNFIAFFVATFFPLVGQKECSYIRLVSQGSRTDEHPQDQNALKCAGRMGFEVVLDGHATLLRLIAA